MPQLPRKAPSRCPHCGFVQDEPEHLISTYCRGCGSYYKVSPPSAGLARYSSEVRTRIRRRLPKIPPRQVRCYHCGQAHEVSGRARTTLCPECNAAIELSDVTVSSSTTRPIDTRGNLIITPVWIHQQCSYRVPRGPHRRKGERNFGLRDGGAPRLFRATQLPNEDKINGHRKREPCGALLSHRDQ